MGGKGASFIQLAAGLVAAILLAFVVFVRPLNRDFPSSEHGAVPTVSVVVAVANVPVRSVLSADALGVKDMPVHAVPEGAVSRVEDVVGMVTLTDLYPGEVILAQRLVDPDVVSGRQTPGVSESEALIALSRENLTGNLEILQPGDQVELFYSLDLTVDRLWRIVRP